MYIETGRMIIRDFMADDWKDLHEILSDPIVMEKCEPAYTPEQTKSFLSEFCIGKKGAFAAVLKENHKVIGDVLFHVYSEGVYEIGWFFNRAYWRRGYAHEACQAVIDYAFQELDAHKIFAETIDAVRSVGMMKKLGMQPEGIQKSQARDPAGNWCALHLYGLLKEDWNRRRNRNGI